MRLALAVALGPSLVTAMLACGAGAGSGTAPTAPSPGAAALEHVATGTTPTLAGARAEHLFTDEAAFDAWLGALGATKPATPIDFSKRVVLAVDGEDGSNGCHAVRILHVERSGGALKVDVARYEPAPAQARAMMPAQACAMMMVRPYDAVAVERTPQVPKATFAWARVTGSPAP
jgi:hypothetical protein